ncbi:hypothetical protein P3S68_032264 [Capsicum galapagoense]
MSAQSIHCEVEHRGTRHKFYVTFVYGYNDHALRRELWQYLVQISGATTAAWAVIGDFNNVLSREERVGRPVTLAKTWEFKQCVGPCSLQDLKSIGPYFTWNNKQEVGCIAKLIEFWSIMLG